MNINDCSICLSDFSYFIYLYKIINIFYKKIFIYIFLIEYIKRYIVEIKQKIKFFSSNNKILILSKHIILYFIIPAFFFPYVLFLLICLIYVFYPLLY